MHEMVQHTSLGNFFNEINEFQVVHALITQSLKGNLSEQESVDRSDVEAANSQNNIITALCQTFNSFNPSHHKRVFPKFVKEFISHVRKSQDRCTPMSSNSCLPCTDKHIPPPRKQSIAVRYATVLKAAKLEECDKSASKAATSTSRVHDKVLQFEKHAAAGVLRPAGERHLSSVPQASCATTCRESPKKSEELPTCSEAPCSRECHSKLPRTENPPNLSTRETPPKAPQKEGRSLKRVPSERFQKMRRKVQRLMSSRSDDVTQSSPAPMDESTYLQSIRIPDPRHARNDSQNCLILRMPDHVLYDVFSFLDTRTLAAVKMSCSDFNFIVNHFDVRATDSRWTKDHRYLEDPCIQCRHMFVRGDMSMCRFHPKRYYSDLPYGRSYWMCCMQFSRSAPGCKTGLHDNHWRKT